MNTNGAVKTVSSTLKEKVPQAANKTGEIARPLLVKLNLAQPKTSVTRQIGMAVIVVAMLAVIKAVFSPTNKT